MVSRKVIEKLSDFELEKYIKPESKFVPEAIEFAYDILKQRGRIFTDSETEQIENFVKTKKNNEPKFEEVKNNGWDKNFTEDENAIELYTNKLIWIFSVFFGVIFGTALQVYNFYKLRNNKAAILTLIFGIAFSILQFTLMSYIGNIEYGRFSIKFLLSGIGAIGLFFIRENLFKNQIQYKAKSFVIPLIIAIVVNIPLIYSIITTH